MDARSMDADAQQVVRLDFAAPHVACVTIDRPQARNAISRAVAVGLAAMLARTEADDAVCAVILTGAGQAFCAGADLKEVAAGGLDALFIGGGGFAGFAHAARRKPWIAAVNGPAQAGGCELALACDMIVASEQASFSLPEVKRSLVAGAGGVYRLARAMPRNIALELIATGRSFSAASAASWGLVNRLVPHGALMQAAAELAAEIVVNAPLAVQESLLIARQTFDREDHALSQLCRQALDRLAATEDYREGPRAFIEKRSPVWAGR